MIQTARIYAAVILGLCVVLGSVLWLGENNPTGRFGGTPFRYGLDLSGGTQLVYDADTEKLDPSEVNEAMGALRDVIERRVNAFGVGEPRVQVQRGGVARSEERLLVELPGITDVDEAIQMIGKTPELEFKLLGAGEVTADENGVITPVIDYQSTGLTGALVKHASVQFNQGQGIGLAEPVVILNFNAEGKDLFAKLTTDHTGEPLAIFLDGEMISSPRINEPITDGTAMISGNFTPEEAQGLVRDLNLGALPVPITLASTNSIGPTLGRQVLEQGVTAGALGFILVVIFLLVWYRVPGLVASLALILYTLFSLTVFKLLPITLTASGIAGFILSIGMAVDANILIFERMKEELREGKDLLTAVEEGFARAWLSIRDSNLSSMITAAILFWFGTSVVKGFALTFGLGVLISMITAITISRTFLLSIIRLNLKHPERWYGSGFGRGVSEVTTDNKN